MKKLPFTIALRKMKYLGGTLTKEVEDPYKENYRPPVLSDTSQRTSQWTLPNSSSLIPHSEAGRALSSTPKQPGALGGCLVPDWTLPNDSKWQRNRLHWVAWAKGLYRKLHLTLQPRHLPQNLTGPHPASPNIWGDSVCHVAWTEDLHSVLHPDIQPWYTT